MAVSEDDVRHIARLARLGLEDDSGTRVPALARELNTILAHMDVLQKVSTLRAQRATGIGSGGMPLRMDGGDPVPLARRIEAFAPLVRDGLLLVPRLASHESGEDAGVGEGKEERKGEGEGERE